jgi:predicted nuclease with TOPRIM domain
MDPGELRQVRQIIERSTSKVSLRELERKGFRKVKVLRSNDINQLIRQAVASAISRAGVDSAQKEELVRQSKDELKRLMKQAQQTETERAELLETNQRLEQEVRRLQTQLQEQTGSSAELAQLKRKLDDANVQVMALESRAGTAEAKLGELTTARTEAEELRATLKRVETEKRLLEDLELPKMRERLQGLEGDLKQARAAALEASGAGIDKQDLRSMMRDLVQEVATTKGDDTLKQEFGKLQQSIAGALAQAGGRRSSEVTEADLEAAKVSLSRLFEHGDQSELESNIANVQVKESTSSGVKSTLNKLKSLRKGGSAE